MEISKGLSDQNSIFSMEWWIFEKRENKNKLI